MRQCTRWKAMQVNNTSPWSLKALLNSRTATPGSQAGYWNESPKLRARATRLLRQTGQHWSKSRMLVISFSPPGQAGNGNQNSLFLVQGSNNSQGCKQSPRASKRQHHRHPHGRDQQQKIRHSASRYQNFFYSTV
jgi:hypothetical protein